MEISWNKVADETIKWEVVFDDQVETITSGNSYVKTKLKPGSTHHIKVRAVKGKEFSPYAERRGATERMREAENPKIVFLICVPSFLTGVARDVF